MDKKTNQALDAATGEALQCSILLSAVLTKLVQKGILETQEVADLADVALLVLEKHRADVQGGPGAIDHARSRLEATISMFSAKPGRELSE